MASATLHRLFVLLLYLQISYGQSAVPNNQNVGGNNPAGLQKQAITWTTNNMNQIPNAVLNQFNTAQQANNQQNNLQQSGPNQGNLQQPMANLPSQTVSVPQNGFQITKIGFTPVSPGKVNNPCSSAMQMQNRGVQQAIQAVQPQNTPISNIPVTQISNSPMSMSALAELLGLKGQSALLSLLNLQNNVQPQQNQQNVMPNSVPLQYQLPDVQNQCLLNLIQGNQQNSGQQGINLVQGQPIMANIQSTPQQGQAIVPQLCNQPTYITAQAPPLASYEKYPQEEPILSMLLSEIDPQYSMNSVCPQASKGSTLNVKSLIPLLINLLQEKNTCQCRNCGCINTCQNNECPNNVMEEPLAQIFGGYSNQKKYGAGSEASPKMKKKDEDLKKKQKKNKKVVIVESEESSEENSSEYIDDEEE